MLHLMSFLGAGDYREAIYDLPRTIRSPYFSVSLAANLRPDRISIYVTEQSEVAHYKRFLAEMERNGLDVSSVQPVRIPTGSTIQEVWEIFDTVIATVKPGEELAFDITYSFRFMPAIAFLSVIYLRAAKGIRLNDLYYAAYQKELEVIPVWRLSGFVDILDWLEGVSAFTGYGDAAPFGGKLREIQGRIRRENQDGPIELQRMGDMLYAIAEGLRLGRPQSVSRAVGEFQHTYGEHGERRAALDRELQKWAKPLTLLSEKLINDFLPLHGDGPVTYMNMADWFVRNGYPISALTLMREAMVSYCILRTDGSLHDELDKDRRRAAENEMNSFEGCFPEHPVSRTWTGLRDLRNDAAHSGFRENPCSPRRFEERTKRILQEVREIMRDESYWKAFDEMKHLERTVLITPLGTSPGTLYSVLRHNPADQVVVLTSHEGAAGIEEVKKTAGFAGKMSVVLVDDPFRCFDTGPILEKCRKSITMPPPYQLTVNVTGGTTALQLAAQAVYRLHRGPKKMIAVVDPRPVVKQKEEAYQLGEAFVIEEK